MNYWLIKSEPECYSWEQFNSDGHADWTDIRNYAARNNMQAMQIGDLALFYHSNTGKDIVGIAEVSKTAFPEPGDDTGKWYAVEFKPYKALKKSLDIDFLRKHPILGQLEMFRLNRLSVSKVTPEQFDAVIAEGFGDEA